MMLAHIASRTTTPSMGSPSQRNAPSAKRLPSTKPFRRPTATSFLTASKWPGRHSSPIAMRRIVTASACVPVFPPSAAITGMRKARNGSAPIRSSKLRITAAASAAVIRFSDSQGSRERTDSSHPALSSSSSDTPASFRMSSVVSASITSITSSKVMWPSSTPPAPTTGTLTRL